MSQPPSAYTPPPDDDVTHATERLFRAIADAVDDDDVRDRLAAMNARLHALRPYEAELLSDREAELAALSDAWAQRDLARLQHLLMAYFARRRALAADLAERINARH